MTSLDLIRLACQLSLRGPQLVEAQGPLLAAGVEQYWIASRCRLDRWAHELKRAAQLTPEFLLETSAPFHDTLCEILASEIVTRVWTAICVAQDRQLGTGDAEPIARSVLVAHLDARHRVLQMLAGPAGIISPAAQSLNILRRQSEHATDVLIAHLGCRYDVFPIAFHPRRAAELAARVQAHPVGGQRQRWCLLVESVRQGFDAGLLGSGANCDLNSAVASSILRCFSPQLFDGAGVPTAHAAAAPGDTPLAILLSSPVNTAAGPTGLVPGRAAGRRQFRS
jgi:hypothetical protein